MGGIFRPKTARSRFFGSAIRLVGVSRMFWWCGCETFLAPPHKSYPCARHKWQKPQEQRTASRVEVDFTVFFGAIEDAAMWSEVARVGPAAIRRAVRLIAGVEEV